MPMDEEKKLSKGFAFVEFHSPEVCISCCTAPAETFWVPPMGFAEDVLCRRRHNRRRRRCASR